VDWRGRGGGVLAPPSRHASGRSYRWLRGLDQAPLAEVPAALRALLEPPAPPPDPSGTPTRPVPVGHPYGRRVLADELARLWQAPSRTRNQTAFKVYRYVGAGVLEDEEVTAAFTDCALAIGLQAAEVRRTLASARTAGLANPRGVPLDPHSRRTP
jgi:Bifunctional DNA primase/polymerase, N-terminal